MCHVQRPSYEAVLACVVYSGVVCHVCSYEVVLACQDRALRQLRGSEAQFEVGAAPRHDT